MGFMLEIEIRAKSNKKIEEKISKDESFKLISETDQTDTYYKHHCDVDRKLVLRIRKIGDKSLLTFKLKAVGEDTAWADVDIPLDYPDNLEKIFRASDYEKVVVINKKRKTYNHNGFEVNVDDIENLGFFIELEGRGNEESRREIEIALDQIMAHLDIKPDDIIRKGYVALMLENLKS